MASLHENHGFSPLFELGKCEVSSSAEGALSKANIEPERLFARHSRGDWGSAEDWLARDNDRSVRDGKDYHAITSRYELGEGLDMLVVTSTDRSRTRLQLKPEYGDIQVSSSEGYAIWAKEYDVRNHLAAAEETVANPIIARLGPVGTVLDVGTGTGRYAMRFGQQGSQVVGLDESIEMLSVARNKTKRDCLENIRWIQAVVGSGCLPFHSNSFDLLVSALCLTHVEDLGLAVSESSRVVRRGGHLVLTDFHPAAVQWANWRTAFRTPDARYTFPNAPHSRENYIDALQSSNCRVHEVYDVARDGSDYGELSREVFVKTGEPPRCLVILAEKI